MTLKNRLMKNLRKGSLAIALSLPFMFYPSQKDLPKSIEEPPKTESLQSSLDSKAKQEYTHLLAQIKERQQKFSIKYRQATPKQKPEIIKKSRAYVFNTLTDKVFPHWNGTPWDFNGTTQTPQKGEIACGYFVSTTLKHAGFNLERILLAQQPSENIIKTLTDKDNINRQIRNYNWLYAKDSPLDFETKVKKLKEDTRKFEQKIKSMGEGLYILGLDNHTGFIINKDNKITFYHSNYIAAEGVINEPLTSSIPILRSEYKVAGKILNKEMMENWLTGKAFKTLIYTPPKLNLDFPLEEPSLLKLDSNISQIELKESL